ncbi:MAG: hypothetical protein CSA33_02325 [Desulfobulbus propionicus]|nr:MAG: hypothetical protein CSA33_02325 [Desulfobulbus propionicus]
MQKVVVQGRHRQKLLAEASPILYALLLSALGVRIGMESVSAFVWNTQVVPVLIGNHRSCPEEDGGKLRSQPQIFFIFSR